MSEGMMGLQHIRFSLGGVDSSDKPGHEDDFHSQFSVTVGAQADLVPLTNV